jgi:hypothetical protein
MDDVQNRNSYDNTVVINLQILIMLLKHTWNSAVSRKLHYWISQVQKGKYSSIVYFLSALLVSSPNKRRAKDVSTDSTTYIRVSHFLNRISTDLEYLQKSQNLTSSPYTCFNDKARFFYTEHHSELSLRSHKLLRPSRIFEHFTEPRLWSLSWAGSIQSTHPISPRSLYVYALVPPPPQWPLSLLTPFAWKIWKNFSRVMASSPHRT